MVLGVLHMFFSYLSIIQFVSRSLRPAAFIWGTREYKGSVLGPMLFLLYLTLNVPMFLVDFNIRFIFNIFLRNRT